jgi:hypothetical protein
MNPPSIQYKIPLALLYVVTIPLSIPVAKLSVLIVAALESSTVELKVVLPI